MDNVARHIHFAGRVQGVGFRFTAYQIARQYELAGFVRNLPDGRVEMLAQGDPAVIDDCLRDISETFGNYITETTIEQVPPNPRHATFEITF